MITRRSLLGAAVGAGFLRAADGRLRIGITDWNLKLTANPESVPLAAMLGFDARADFFLDRNSWMEDCPRTTLPSFPVTQALR